MRGEINHLRTEAKKPAYIDGPATRCSESSALPLFFEVGKKSARNAAVCKLL